MVIDHIGYIYLGNDWLARLIGRITFPLFIYSFSIGCLKTSDEKKRIIRILITAVITEPLFDYASFGSWWYPQYQNILFTFALAAAGIMAMDKEGRTYMDKSMITVVTAMAAEILKFDYGALGIVSIYICYYIIKTQKPAYMTFIAWIPLIIETVQYPVLIIGYLLPTPIILLQEKFGKDKPISNRFVKLFFRYFYTIQFAVLVLASILLK
jgi:hypothetical protein